MAHKSIPIYQKQTAPRHSTTATSSAALSGISRTAVNPVFNSIGTAGQAKVANENEGALQINAKALQLKAVGEEEALQKKPYQFKQAEEELQMKKVPFQLAEMEEDETVQKKIFPFQLKGVENEEPLQMKPWQLVADKPAANKTGHPNQTGLPNNLKAGIEHLSGIDISDVKVHYNSAQPAQLHALAYAQGTDIHVAPGQERHLPHEAWHVVQQKQGRVQPTVQMKAGIAINDDKGLENEADVMGAKAFQFTGVPQAKAKQKQQVMPEGSPWVKQLSTYQAVDGSNHEKQVNQAVDGRGSLSAGAAAGPQLLALLDEIQTVTTTAAKLAKEAGDAPLPGDTDKHLNELRKIAEGSDEAAKASALARLRSQIGDTGPALSLDKPIDQQVIQREGMGGSELVIAAVALVATTLFLATAICRGFTRRRPPSAVPTPGEVDPTSAVMPIPIPGDLTMGITPMLSNAEKARTLFDNINGSPFNYTGQPVGATAALISRAGDCQTLARMYKLVAERMGITGVIVANEPLWHLVAPRAIHGRPGAMSNTDNIGGWLFKEHYWVTVGAAHYDLLFAEDRPVPYATYVTTIKHNGVNFRTFAGGFCVIPSQGRNSPLTVVIEGAGRVFSSEQQTRDFIDRYRRP